jgi:hypothetical protein
VSKPNAVDAVLSIAAVWMALRGDDPRLIAARAQAAADAAETARRRIEALAMRQVRTAMDCQAPALCACLVCKSIKQGELS